MQFLSKIEINLEENSIVALFPIQRVLVDRENNPIKILILASAYPLLIRQSSEALAGRISYLQLTPFSINETSMDAYLATKS